MDMVRVFFKLISKDSIKFKEHHNDMLYKDVPNTDLALTLYCLDWSGEYSFAVNHGFAEQFGATDDGIFALANEFLSKQEYRFNPLGQMISEISDEIGIEAAPGDTPELYVLTNKNGTYGATMITREDVRKAIGDKIGYPYIVLPSSVHEVLIRKDNGEIDVNDLLDMVIEINNTEVAPDDVLSDHVYRVGSDNKLRKIL